MTFQWKKFYTFTNYVHSNSRIPAPTKTAKILPFEQIRIKNRPLVLRQFKESNDYEVIHSIKQRKTWITCAATGAALFRKYSLEFLPTIPSSVTATYLPTRKKHYSAHSLRAIWHPQGMYKCQSRKTNAKSTEYATGNRPLQ